VEALKTRRQEATDDRLSILLYLGLSHDEDRKMADLASDSWQQKYCSGRGMNS
jgi:hypothetical protein